MNKVIVLMDNVPLKDLGIFVSDSKGWHSKPSFKETSTKTEWKDENGYDLDLSKRFVEAREINLTCFGFAANSSLFLKKYIDFLNKLDAPVHRRISLVLDDLRFEYDVYRDSSIDTEIIFDDSSAAGAFSIKLIENQPVKKTIKFQATTTNTRTGTITFNSNKILRISWGDGTIEHTRTGLNTYSRKYAANGIYYPLLIGDVDSIGGFKTNGTELWSK